MGTRLARRSVTPTIERFLKQYPDVKVEHSKFGPDSRLEDYDIVITDDSLQSDQFEKLTVLRERMVLVAAKGILPAGELTPKILKKLTFVSLPQDSIMYQNTLCICRNLGFEPKMLTEDSVYFVPSSVEKGVGVAVTYPHAEWFNFMAHLLDVRDLGEYYRSICVYYRKKSASRHTEHFCEILLNIFHQQIN